MFFGPIEINSALTHSFEGTLHAKRAEIDVREDQRDEERADYSVKDFRKLHVADVKPAIEREHQYIAADHHCYAAEHDKPVEQLLPAIELIRGRMTPALAHTATHLEPFDVCRGWEILADPHQEHQHNTGGKAEAQDNYARISPIPTKH